ncbi:MAG: hypothetical protein KF845_02965 [Cyclobacteriaceae bacterium]|nr:hypothetical protein [Cyclobacteriaceae bacterium]
MTEEKTRELISRSLLKTSEGFADRLVEKVETQKAGRKKTNVLFLLSCIGCFMLLFLPVALIKSVNFSHIQLTLPPITIKVLCSLIVFITINRLIFLRKKILQERFN